MKIIERMKNIFESNGLPRDFVHNGEYDMVFLFQTFGRIPSIVKARNGRKYMYFEDMTPEKLKIIRKMGFRPHRHQSRRYTPAKVIYRAPISIMMQQSAWNVVTRIELDYNINEYGIPKSLETFQNNKRYQEYTQAYKTKQKTK